MHNQECEAQWYMSDETRTIEMNYGERLANQNSKAALLPSVKQTATKGLVSVFPFLQLKIIVVKPPLFSKSEKCFRFSRR